METKEALLAAGQLKLSKLETIIQAARSPSRCSEELLTLAKRVLNELEVMEGEIELQKRLCSNFCLTVDHAATEVQRQGLQKTGFERLFSALFTPCINGGLNLSDRRMELQAIAAEIRNKELCSRNRGTEAADFVPSSAGSQSPMESLDSQSILSKGVSREVAMQDNDGRSIVNKSPQPGAFLVEADLFGKAKRLRKASRQETITSMKFVPLKANEDWRNVSGRVWFYITRLFGADKMVIYNLSSDIEEQADSIKTEGAVTTMHLDSRGILWSGHRSGAVIAWKEDEKKALCAGARACSSSVRVITSDETGMVWVGSEKGDVRRLGFIAGSGISGFELQLHRHLRHTGAGVPERSASANIDPVSQMVRNLRAKEKAHEGPVTSLAAAVGRVWTAGGSAAFVCLREWTQRGEFLKKHDLKSIGAALSMLIVSPIVRVTTSPDPASSLSSGASGNLESSIAFRSTELPQTWQLLTGHGNGVIQVWGDARGMLCPLLRIGGDASPITAVAVHAPMGLICSSHLDGRLVVQAVPHPRGQSALAVTLVDGSVSQVKLRKGEIKVADSGISAMESGPSGVVTVAYDASIVFWPAAALRSAAEGGGITISEPSNIQEQWPLRVFDPQDVPVVSSQPFAPRPTTPAGALKFSDDASRWQIEYSDLTLTRVIGEGAFGQVYLGRWHETDVAIKMLSSLSALGLPSAGEVGTNAAGEAIKTLEREVALMVNMRHPNVILFMGICPEPFCIVTEYCSRGSLYDLLRSARNDPVLAQQLSWPRRLGLAMDSAKGMLYLHSHKPHVIHRDLKSPNLLVDGQWRAKVTDFNLSRLSEAPSVASSVAANNPRWQAPEVIHSRDFSASGDVYAFGIILWELATWELPFEQLTQFQIILAVGEKGGRPEIPDPSSPTLRGGDFPGYADYVTLMEACWAQNPKDRPGFDQIIAMLRKIVVGLGSEGGHAAPMLSEENLSQTNVEQELPVSVPTSNDQYAPAICRPFGGAAVPLKSPFDEAPTIAAAAAAATVNVPPSPFGEIAMSPFDMPAAAALPPIKVAPLQTDVPLRVIDSATDSFEGHVAGSSSNPSK